MIMGCARQQKRIALVLTAVLILVGFVCGCGMQAKSANGSETQIIVDSIGREVEIPKPVKKVAVANGYNTELINAIGAIDRVIGVDYGIYQNQEAYKGRFQENQLIGKSQRELNYEKIIALAPEVLILTGNGAWEDAEKKLGDFGIQVVVLDAYYTEKFQQNCELVGKIFGREKQSAELAGYFEGKLSYIRTQLQHAPKKTLYFEYRREGSTTVPGDYFYKMVEFSGAKNIFDDAANVQVSPEAVLLRNPDYIVKVGEQNVSAKYIPPSVREFAARKQRITSRPGWDEISAVRNDKILLLSHFSHGGASKLIATMYIAKFLYPEHLPELHPEQVLKEWLTKYQGLDYVSGHTYPAFALEE